MALNSLIDKFFGKTDKSPKTVAKDRLRLVLMHDRADIPAPTMELIRQDIIAVISKHLDIDEKDIHINLAREDNEVALVANIPIRRVRPEKTDHP
jgi:cell division topological specificity factor